MPKRKKNNFKINKQVRMESLNPGKIPRVRREFLDVDYLHLLSEEELRWYAQFIDEWLGANIRKDGEGNILPGHLHNTKELAKTCYDSNNKRNNDVYSIAKANNLLISFEEFFYKIEKFDTNDNNLDKNSILSKLNGSLNNKELVEDAIINEIDQKNVKS